jgi:hypothetical protein
MPTTPAAKEVVAIARGTGSIVSVYCFWIETGVAAASVTLIVKLDAPELVGVPEIQPAAFMVSPWGSDPEATLHVHVPTPPVS